MPGRLVDKRPLYASPTRSVTVTVIGLARLQGDRDLAQIARDLGVHPSYMSRIWGGQRIPSLEVTWKLAGVLGVPVEELARVLLGLDAPVAKRKAA